MGTAILPDEQLETKTARARREWNEAWSSIAASRRIWQIAAGVEALTVMACVFGLIHLGSLPKQSPMWSLWTKTEMPVTLANQTK